MGLAIQSLNLNPNALLRKLFDQALGGTPVLIRS